MSKLIIILIWQIIILCATSEDIIAPAYPAPQPLFDAKPFYPNKAIYEDGRRPYEYSYAVKDDKTGANFNAAESSDGKIVNGFYSVLLPDGRRQNTKYTVDDYNGYIADVSYDEQSTAIHPPPINPYRPQQKELVPKPAPIYRPISPPKPISNYNPSQGRLLEPIAVPVHNLPVTTPFPIQNIAATSRADFKEETNNIVPKELRPVYSFRILRPEPELSTVATIPTFSLPV